MKANKIIKVTSYFIIILILFFVSCKTKIDNNSKDLKVYKQNYIPYYLKVEKSKSFYLNNEPDKCFELLDSLFNIYKPVNTFSFDELELYCELAVKNNKTDKLNDYVDILVSNYGYDLANNKDSLWILIKKESKFSDYDLKLKYNNFLNGINHNLRDSIIEIFKEDQDVRKTRNSFKIDSIDRINELKTVDIIKKYGYPTIKLIGGHGKDEKLSPATISVLLKHISYENVKQIQPLLLEEIKNGKCPPFVYAGMLDVRKIVAKEETDFEYFGTIKNVHPTDTTETNIARENIGLSKIKF